MAQNTQQALDFFLQNTLVETDKYIGDISRDDLFVAAGLIWDAQSYGGRVHTTGVGKCEHVASYIASLLSSTGTPCYFLHTTEAVHGSCGQLLPGDIVICISNSGETFEMKAAVQAIKNNGCNVIAVTGNSESWLAKQGKVHLFAGVSHEGGPLNRAPRMSVLAQIIILQALSIILQEERQITVEQYIKWHPGGALGKIE
ncbi:MAG: SIS domain-containing protein [Anaerolineaceae bacterium]